MSPHVWQVLEGSDRIVVSLIDADEKLDQGAIWNQLTIRLSGIELHDEIHSKLFDAECALMTWAIENCDRTTPRAQVGEPSFYRRRTPADSAIDPLRPLAESFDLLRIADPDRYPAYFDFRGARVRIRIDRL